MNELIRLRASSLSDLFDCPARWAAKHLYGRRLPKSGVAQLGTAVHVGTALYDNSVLHDSAPLSVADCEGEVVDTIWRPEEDIDWGDSSPKAAEPVALALHRLYCERVAPRFQYVAVEATCEDLALPELGITLTGTTDRVFQDDVGDFGIADIKTGRSSLLTAGSKPLRTLCKWACMSCWPSRLPGKRWRLLPELLVCRRAKQPPASGRASGKSQGHGNC